ncbi:MAG: hypothetical protein WCI67_11050 [Chloroflexales bacterium]
MQVITRRVIALLIVLGITLGFGVAPTVSHAQSASSSCQPGFLPTNDPLHPYQIILTCIPTVWNGNLVVYAHGYVDPSLQLSLPAELNLYLADGITPNPASLPAVLLSQGYAFATTSYRKNGYDVEQGGQDIDALVAAVKQSVLPAKINRIYLVGASQGALISTMLVERSPKTYNGGALALCGAVGGWAYETQYTGDFATVFNYFFKGVADSVFKAAAQGATIEDQAAIVGQAFQARPDLAAQLFSVTGAAVVGSDFTNPAVVANAVDATLQVLFFSGPTAKPDLQTTAGGNPYGNLRTRYRGSLDNAALNAGVTRVAADRAAQRYVRRFYTPSGEITRPIVTLHNTLDPVVPFAVEQLFAQRVKDEHRSSLLTSIPARISYGHCKFEPPLTRGPTDPGEVLSAFGVLVTQSSGHDGHSHEVDSADHSADLPRQR